MIIYPRITLHDAGKIKSNLVADLEKQTKFE